MSVHPHAYVIYGIVCSKELISQAKEVRGCSHQLQNTPFCGQCGQPAWVLQEENSLQQISSEGEVGYIMCERLDAVVVGICLGVASAQLATITRLTQPNNPTKGKLGEFLAKHGLNLKSVDPQLYLVMTGDDR